VLESVWLVQLFCLRGKETILKIEKYHKACRQDAWLRDVLPGLINHGRLLFDKPIAQTQEALEKWIETTAIHIAFHPYGKLTGNEQNLRKEAELGRPIGPAGEWRATAMYYEVFHVLGKTLTPEYPAYRVFPLEESDSSTWGSRHLRSGFESRDLYGVIYDTVGVVKRTQAEISGFCCGVAFDIFKFPPGTDAKKLVLGTPQI